MDIKEAEDLARLLMREHGLYDHGYSFKWIRAENIFGIHNENPRQIQLSKPLTSINPIELVKDTILHEIAHAIDFIRNGYSYRKTKSGRNIYHDKVWKDICIEIGCKPQRNYGKEVVSVPRQYKWKLVHDATLRTIKFAKRRQRKYEEHQYLIDGMKSFATWERIYYPNMNRKEL